MILPPRSFCASVFQVNNINRGSNSPVFQSNELKNNDKVHVIVDADGSCSTVIKDTSEAIIVTVSGSPATTVNISGKTDVVTGEAASIAANISNPGQQPVYQSQDSTHTHGWQDIENAFQSSINYTPAISGDKLRCVFKSVSGCVYLTW